MRKIGVIFVVVIALGGLVFFTVINENSVEKDANKQTKNTIEFFDFRPSSSTVSTDVTEEKVSDSSSIQDKLNETKDSDASLSEEKLAFLKINSQLLDAYYGDLTNEEKNKLLKNILSESLHEEYLLPDHEGIIFYGDVAMFDYRSFHSQQDKQATVINILEMVADGLEQRVLITVELEFNGQWLISDLKFESIYG